MTFGTRLRYRGTIWMLGFGLGTLTATLAQGFGLPLSAALIADALIGFPIGYLIGWRT